MAAELIQKCIGENARIAQNQGEYAKRYDALVERWLHCQTTFRYLSLECQTLEPYQLPQSPQRILLEKMLTQLFRPLTGARTETLSSTRNRRKPCGKSTGFSCREGRAVPTADFAGENAHAAIPAVPFSP